ncbi:MAG: hypothetical protein ACI9J3_000183 [Parvicellaceae bacterium]|jgi:hypothetical protein
MKNTIFLFAIFFLTSCVGVEPLSEYDKKTDFNTFKTFTICESISDVPYKYEMYDNAESRKIMKEILIDQMQSYGYVHDELSPDLLVSYELKFNDIVLKYTECRRSYEYQVWEGCKIVEYPFTEGTMILTIMENTFSQIVWIGSLEGPWVDSEETRYERSMRSFIRNLFKNFPKEKSV